MTSGDCVYTVNGPMAERTKRIDLRVTHEELRAIQWAVKQDGADGISAWLRQIANQRIRKLRREVES